MNKLQQLHELGQSTWLNTLNRPFIQSGELRTRIADGIQGFTANAANFDSILTTTTAYDKAIWEQVRAGMPAPRIHNELIVQDLQIAADSMHDVYQQSDGLEGYVCLELNPALMHDAVNTVAEVTHLETVINRPNAMVEVPATPAGIDAVKHLTKDGVSVNLTHVFSVAVYEQAAQAYLEGLEIFLDTHSVWRFVPVSVVSFSLSPIDEAVDPLLLEKGKTKLLGKTAVSLAKLLYNNSKHIFSGSDWEKLAKQGGCILRPKWSRTTPRGTAYPKRYYLEALIGSDTVTTFSNETLPDFMAHGSIAPSLTTRVDEAQEHMRQLNLLGIDIDAIAQ
ncbi:MAG: transaldolase, partial [Anaerolineae bacterium]|nr:transaldolase [Anaerolineae bacterium]